MHPVVDSLKPCDSTFNASNPNSCRYKQVFTDDLWWSLSTLYWCIGDDGNRDKSKCRYYGNDCCERIQDSSCADGWQKKHSQIACWSNLYERQHAYTYKCFSHASGYTDNVESACTDIKDNCCEAKGNGWCKDIHLVADLLKPCDNTFNPQQSKQLSLRAGVTNDVCWKWTEEWNPISGLFFVDWLFLASEPVLCVIIFAAKGARRFGFEVQMKKCTKLNNVIFQWNNTPGWNAIAQSGTGAWIFFIFQCVGKWSRQL